MYGDEFYGIQQRKNPKKYITVTEDKWKIMITAAQVHKQYTI